MTLDQVTLTAFTHICQLPEFPVHAIYCYGTRQLTIHGEVDMELKKAIATICDKDALGLL